MRLHRTTFRLLGMTAAAMLVFTTLGLPAGAKEGRPKKDKDKEAAAQHVLFVSVDGLHQSDLAWYMQTHPHSTLAGLAARGIDYSNASTPFPSDSFPGLVGPMTGGDPGTTGVYYDDSWNRALLPPGTTTCNGAKPGAEVTYFEALDKNLGALDAGQGVVPAPGSDPWANILQMTRNPLDVIDRKALPVDPASCSPVPPNQYLRVNTVFEVAHQHHLATAWSDKHPAYQILAGPSGAGVDDFFTPEINSSAQASAPTDPNQDDWTTDNLKTQQYDRYKVAAVLNWIDGHYHDGQGHLGTPAILGMNFQSVSTAQKLPGGGYQADGSTPGPLLTRALDFVDGSLLQIVNELSSRHLLDSTTIIVSAKHGQSPMNPAALNRINDGKIVDALNAAWMHDHGGTTPLVAFSINDDGMIMWLNDRSTTALAYAKDFLSGYHDDSASLDGKPVTSAGLSQIYVGTAAAQIFGVPVSDSRVPDLVGMAQYGVVYTSKKKKIAEHGGNHTEDRNVPILVAGPGVATADRGSARTNPVETTQIAPTILRLLGLSADELQAVQAQHTLPLP